MTTMTVNQLIRHLTEMGDEKWRDSAKVRILDNKGGIIDENLDAFNIKSNHSSADIYVNHSGWYISEDFYDEKEKEDEEEEEYDDWEDEDNEKENEDDDFDDDGNREEEDVI